MKNYSNRQTSGIKRQNGYLVWSFYESNSGDRYNRSDEIDFKRSHPQITEMGITVYMLTGDNEDTAREIAQKAAIGHYKSSVLPQDKALFIKQLQQEGKKVAMVGDGINDSAALAQADLSIAMGKEAT